MGVVVDPLGGPGGRDRQRLARPRTATSRSPLEPHSTWLLDLVAREPDLTLLERERRIAAEVSLTITERSIRRFFARHRITLKKSRARGRAGQARRGRGARALDGDPSRA